MNFLFISIISIVFLYFNYKIIISDIKEKIIPNKYLLYLLGIIPFYYSYLYFNYDIFYISFLIQILLTLLLGFIIYYFGIWGAGDAKYLLILGLFIPNIGIINFVINIVIFMALYLIVLTILNYIFKYIKDINYRNDIYKNQKLDFYKYIERFRNNKTKNINIYLITKFIINFLIIFISIRIYKTYLIENFGNTGIFGNITNLNKIIIIVIVSIFIIILLKYIFSILKIYLSKMINLNMKEIDFIFMILAIGLFFLFTVYEVSLDKTLEFKNQLYKILTLYIIFYIIIKIFIYYYKLNFKLLEYEYKNINILKKDLIIDKEYLIKKIGNMGMLNYYEKLGVKLKSNDKKRLGIGNYKNFYEKINKKLDEDDIIILKNHFATIKKLNKHFNLPNIKIIKTFSFGPYIFIGFIITYIFNDYIIKTLIDKIYYFIN